MYKTTKLGTRTYKIWIFPHLVAKISLVQYKLKAKSWFE